MTIKIYANELKLAQIPQEIGNLKLKKDFGEDGKIFRDLLVNKLTSIFPGKILSVINQKTNLFYSLSLAVYFALKSNKSIHGVQVITLNDVIEIGTTKQNLEEFSHLKVISIIDFDSKSELYAKNKNLLQSFIKSWLDSGKSIITLTQSGLSNSSFDSWFKNYITPKVVVER